ncbi:MAG: PSD1 and planctomycete cytochrome C domain-containing protein [Limisphaerales bacterium]
MIPAVPIAPGTRHAASGSVRSAGWVASLLAALALPSLPVPAVADLPHSETEFFEKRIRPLLADHCYECHSAVADKLRGGLSLDSRDGLIHGGDLGPALIPGDPEKSLLIRAVRHDDPELRMPPKKAKLSDRQIADLAQWVRAGAPWPDESTGTPKRKPRETFRVTDEDRAWWAFQPIRFPEVPTTAGGDLQPVDAFIESALETKGLRPNPPATRRELVRRAYFDLLGLPPEPEAVEAFEKDSSPDAWPRLVDSLLANPRYGERWARHWLDVVRFAQSTGYERDGEKPLAWRYRDYVVRAFNEDKPYPRFILEQIAGDELEPYSADAVIATGFQRLGVWDDEPDDKRMAEFDELDDVLSTTATTFLGLTVGCARCHDHKFDPLPQTDYYRLLAFFRNLRLSEEARYTLDSANYLPLADPEEVDHWRAVRSPRLHRLQESLAVASDDSTRQELTRPIEQLKAEPAPWEWALGVRERGPVAPPTHVLVRGNAGTPGAEVDPGFPAVFSPDTPPAGSPQPPPGPGRRLALARWIADPANPLTARVLVNRVWHHHFGRGIVRTVSDFGRSGSPPSHPDLLQWLAADFLAHGGSIKHLHRTLMLSRTYQRSSQAERPDALAVDPGNEFHWRQNLRRLEAEAMRDTFLSISGQLNLKMGGRGFFPRLSGEVLAGQSRPGLDWEVSSVEELSRRSLYTYIRRSMMVPILETFDYSNTSSPLSERSTTTVAPQSLLLLNDSFMQQQARALADRLVDEAGEDPVAWVRRGFQLAVGRPPSPSESRLALDFLQRQQSEFEQLRKRLTFRPDVPPSLSVKYMAMLRPEDFLIGPTSGWTYFRGSWSEAYEGIRTQNRDRGAFALWRGNSASNVVIEARLLPHTAFESGGLLFRARARDDSAEGYEVLVEPRDQRLLLRRLSPATQAAPNDADATVLASAPVPVPEGGPVPVRIEAADDRIRVWAGGAADPVIDVRDPAPIVEPGAVGVRARGAALSLDNVVIRPAGGPAQFVIDATLSPPRRRALESLGLLLLNLNEVVYIE